MLLTGRQILANTHPAHKLPGSALSLDTGSLLRFSLLPYEVGIVILFTSEETEARSSYDLASRCSSQEPVCAAAAPGVSKLQPRGQS